jgi:hypothetical protein
MNNNEASKQNLSQQWTADRLINHNFSCHKSTEIIFLPQLYEYKENSWLNNNEASKQNLSQQWIADRLMNHNFSSLF